MLSGPKLKHVSYALVIGALCAVIALLMGHTRIVQTWELKAYDWRMRTTASRFEGDIALLYVDEQSLRHMEEMGVGWPWPREMYAPALDFLKRGGAQAVFFDIIYSEDSVYGVIDDEKIARGIERGPKSYFAVFATTHEGPDDPRIDRVMEKMRINFEGSAPSELGQIRSFQSLPIEPIVIAAHAFGNVQSPPDADGTYRRIPLAWRFGKDIVPSIALKIAADRTPDNAVRWLGDKHIAVGAHKLPIDSAGNMLLRFPENPDAIPTYPLGEVLVSQQQIVDGERPRIDPSLFKNKIVIVGLSAPGLYDLKASPVSHVVPGAFIHATAVANLLSGQAMTAASLPMRALVIAIMACAAALGLSFLKRWWSLSLYAAGLVAVLFAGTFLFFASGYWLPLITPLFAMILSSTTTLMRNYLTEGRKKLAIKRAFGQYLSPEVVNEIAQDPEHVELGGSRKEISILFSDIAGFTPFSEKLTPEELVGRLNEYLTVMTEIILKHGGTLDKYIGDAIMAFWGAPLAVSDHAARATRAALEMQNAISRFPDLATRIGIHTGPAVVGNIGSDQRFNYTAMGDVVNLASRLEGLNKYFGTRVLVSESTKRGFDADIICRRLGSVRVKGRGEPIDIFEPFGTAADVPPDRLKAMESCEKGIDLFSAGNYEVALKSFEEAARSADDPVASYYIEICKEVLSGSKAELKDGIIDFKTK
jgi:adenylate cyclase